MGANLEITCQAEEHEWDDPAIQSTYCIACGIRRIDAGLRDRSAKLEGMLRDCLSDHGDSESEIERAIAALEERA